MSDYRRLYTPGGTYFFTVVTYNREPLFADNNLVAQLRRSMRVVKAKCPFAVVAGVVLPNHIHCIWTLPKDDANFSTRWQMIKTEFSRHLPATTRKDGSKTVWQPRFYEHLIRDDEDFHRHLDYIHYNPVRHGLVATPAEWGHSSFARFAAMGWYSTHWGETAPPDVDDMEHD